MTRAARPALTIDVLVVSDLWDAKAARTTLRRAVTQAASALSTTAAELAIVLTDDSVIRALNRDWRGIDKATNVLAFPTKDAAPKHLGDIVIAFETVARESRSEGKPLAHHLAHLAVHGFLHLVGYDHEYPRQARKMEGLEREILHQLAIPDPYGPTRNNSRKRIVKAAAKRRKKS